MVKSKVYYIPVKETDSISDIQAKLRKLLRQSKILDIIQPQNRAVLKTHFGEEGNTGHVKPDFVRVIAEGVLEKQAHPILSDTNTLYRGQRTNAKDHLRLAHKHGFTAENTKTEVFIPEDNPQNVISIPVNQKYIQDAKIAKIFADADVLIDISHFKGHMMTGFGGALKNIAMGCASREGKLAQHSDVSPFVITKKCVGCEVCITECPADAIILINQKASIEPSKCIGCAGCIAVCPEMAIDVNWQSGSGHIQEKMIEYAKAVIDAKKDKAAYINFAIKITQECDCLAKDDPRIAPDLGIFASLDPVSIDKACYDMLIKTCRKDILKEVHPHQDGMRQLSYAVELGLGNLEYALITVA